MQNVLLGIRACFVATILGFGPRRTLSRVKFSLTDFQEGECCHP